MNRFFLFFFAVAASAWAADPVEFSVGTFHFDRPEGWAWVTPSSPMRKAQLATPGDGSVPGEVTFFHFGPGEGGGVQANVDRWLGQFSDGTSDTKTEQVGKTSVTFVQAAGTFASGMPGGPTTPKTAYAMRGAILQSAGGDVYVKLTGPEAVVKAAEGAFEKMVRSAALK
ncbi:MAG TPA: hypothetical protein PLS03_11755 [Terrimicrobiaceae bacterium]|nr:hypothetical protein [Terrimicrobiaceae bacterium]